MKKLFRFYWNVGRMGNLEGLFIATQEQVDSIIGKEIYFGEVLGKHSEIYGVIESKDIREVTRDTLAVKVLSTLFESTTICGYNPFDYLEEG